MRIGIDVGGTKIEGAAVAPQGHIIARERRATAQGDYHKIITTIGELVSQLETSTGLTGSVGLGIPGTISPKTGKVKNANSTCLIGKPFQQDLSAALGRPVRVANDANCFAISEAIDGAAADANVVFGCIIGTGCGAGLVVNGKILTGRHAITGEWGHNPLPWPEQGELPGPACYCGKQGCIETWLSGPGFAADYARAGGANLTAQEIVSRYRQGDPTAGQAVDRYLDRMARSLSSIINIIDPDVIVMGGGMSNIAEIYDQLPQRLGAYTFSDVVDTPIRQNKHGDSGGVRGAAWLWPEESVGSS